MADMDYKELATDLLSGCAENCTDCEYAGDSEFECTIAQLAANAITDLLDRAEAAERKAKDLEQALYDASKIVKTMQESTIPFYRRRAEEAEASNSQIDGTVKTLMESNKKLADALREAESRAKKSERERDAAIKELDGVSSAVDDLADFIDREIHPIINYNLYLDLRENADAISMFQHEREWRGQKEE